MISCSAVEGVLAEEFVWAVADRMPMLKKHSPKMSAFIVV